MKISEYIFELERLQQEHGDLEIETLAFDFRRIKASAPVVGYKLILQGRESKPRFFYDGINEKLRGEKVIHI